MPSKRKSKKSSRKPCRKGQVRSRSTGRCYSPKSVRSRSMKKSRSKGRGRSKKKSSKKKGSKKRGSKKSSKKKGSKKKGSKKKGSSKKGSRKGSRKIKYRTRENCPPGLVKSKKGRCKKPRRGSSRSADKWKKGEGTYTGGGYLSDLFSDSDYGSPSPKYKVKTD